jgi:hypothetical protein
LPGGKMRRLAENCRSAGAINGGLAREVTMLASDDDQVLVIRFWREAESTESRTSRHWRARIIYVNDGQQVYAPSVDDAFAVIRSLLLAGKCQS